jgi:hypothetical protein
MSVHSDHSSNREKLLEHLFIGEVLRYLWQQGVRTVEFLRSEVDSGGYDLVIDCNSIIRHIQLKSSHREAKTARQNVHLRLADKPSGCVVWVLFDESTLNLGPFLWFGGLPGEPLPDIRSFPVAKHTKGNAQGVKAFKPNIRVVNRVQFQEITSVAELVERLFGSMSMVQHCPICSAVVETIPRYPRYVCEKCVSLTVSSDGRPLTFGNEDISGVFVGMYADTGEAYMSHECFINSVLCRADEARFGGIVIEVIA